MKKIIFILVIIVFCFGSFSAEKVKVVKVSPRIVTPTNKAVRIVCTSEQGLNPTARIYDITGSEVTRLEIVGDLSQTTTAYFEWRPDDNIPSGIYIYQVELKGTVYNGTIVVAR